MNGLRVRTDMAKYKKSDFRPSSEWIATLPEDVQQRAQEGAARILEEMHLSNVRKALTVTQSDLAEKTAGPRKILGNGQ